MNHFWIRFVVVVRRKNNDDVLWKNIRFLSSSASLWTATSNRRNGRLPMITNTSITSSISSVHNNIRMKWSISLDDLIERTTGNQNNKTPTTVSSHNPLSNDHHVDDNDSITSTTTILQPEQQSPPPPPQSPKQHKVLDISTYHGWDSMDAQDTNDNNDDDTTGLLYVTKKVATWDPIRKMIVKNVVTTLVTSTSSSSSSKVDNPKDSTIKSSSRAALTTEDFSYDGKNMKLKMKKAQKKIQVKAAQNDPLSRFCKMCPICRKHFMGHKSMVSHLLYRDKCYHELDPKLQQELVRQKHLEQAKRYRHKMRKMHLLTDDVEIVKVEPTTVHNNNDNNGNTTMAPPPPQRDLRFKLQKTIPDSERTMLYKEKMRLINEKYAAIAAATSTKNTNATTTTITSSDKKHKQK